MQKKRNKLFVFSTAISEIFLLISMSFAISVLMSDFVSGDESKSSLNNHLPNEEMRDPPPMPLPSATPMPAGAAGASKFVISSLSGVHEGSKIFMDGKTMVVSKVGDGKVFFEGDTNGYTLQSLKESNAVVADETKIPLAGSVYGGLSYLVKGLMWSAMVVGAIQLIGAIGGFDKGLTKSLSIAAFGGIMSAKFIGSLGPTGFGAGKNLLSSVFGEKISSGLVSGWGQFAVGAVVAISLFLLTYSKEKKKTVEFKCLPYEAPLGGKRCEECNKDPFRPCTEYRCRALGQGCVLENAGTGKEICVWKSKWDVESPKITPWTEALKPSDLRYEPDTAVRPPALGTKIVSNTDSKCLPAFTHLEFGFTTNEPAQCKIDYNRSIDFDAMKYYVGGSNYYEYNHTQIMRLPGPSNLSDIAPLLRNDGSFALYVRCRDANGNVNVDEYSFSFCVDAGPDTTPPRIEGTSIPSGSFVRNNVDNVPIEVYVNEPAECRWSIQSKAFEDMENTMDCATDPSEINANLLYTCSGNLTGIKNQEDNVFYFKCKDQPNKPENERNKMVQSYVLTLKGSRPLTINSVGPNETITGSTSVVNVELTVETGNGAEEGKAICLFSDSGSLNSFVAMFETNSHLHKQMLQLTNGLYTYYFRCTDAGGNTASANTTFSVFTDKNPPLVTRIYKDQALKIVTDEEAECRYSLTGCNFNIEDGLRLEYPNLETKNEHYLDWTTGKVYYIKCMDKYGNEPSPNACSAVVKPVEISKENSDSSNFNLK